MSQNEPPVRRSSDRNLVLSRSPLVRVLTQIRWPQLGGFDVNVIGKNLSSRLAKTYPLVSQNHEAQLTLSLEGVQQHQGGVVHRFASLDEKWVIGLGETFLALETSEYVSHDDFIGRLGDVATALTEVADIPFWNRFGYRYTNRLDNEEDLNRIGDFFKSAVLGGLALDHSSELVHSISESVYREEGGFLLVRSARLPPLGSMDPTLPPVDSLSWMLDLDAYDESRSPDFTPSAITSKATQLARVAYNYFEAVITPDFKERFK